MAANWASPLKRPQLNTVLKPGDSLLGSAVDAAKERTFSLHPVAHNPAAAMLAGGSESVDGAFEAIKNVGFFIHSEFKALVILISTNLTLGHFRLSFQNDQIKCPKP
jgi:hypothetical protein